MPVYLCDFFFSHFFFLFFDYVIVCIGYNIQQNSFPFFIFAYLKLTMPIGMRGFVVDVIYAMFSIVIAAGSKDCE